MKSLLKDIKDMKPTKWVSAEYDNLEEMSKIIREKVINLHFERNEEQGEKCLDLVEQYFLPALLIATGRHGYVGNTGGGIHKVLEPSADAENPFTTEMKTLMLQNANDHAAFVGMPYVSTKYSLLQGWSEQIIYSLINIQSNELDGLSHLTQNTVALLQNTRGIHFDQLLTAPPGNLIDR